MTASEQYGSGEAGRTFWFYMLSSVAALLFTNFEPQGTESKIFTVFVFGCLVSMAVSAIMLNKIIYTHEAKGTIVWYFAGLSASVWFCAPRIAQDIQAPTPDITMHVFAYILLAISAFENFVIIYRNLKGWFDVPAGFRRIGPQAYVYIVKPIEIFPYKYQMTGLEIAERMQWLSKFGDKESRVMAYKVVSIPDTSLLAESTTVVPVLNVQRHFRTIFPEALYPVQMYAKKTQ